MDQLSMMEVLGMAFCRGNVKPLRPLMAENCYYASQLGVKTICGADEIISGMKAVFAVAATDVYTFETVKLESVLAEGLTLADLDSQAGMHPCSYGLLLRYRGWDKPAAVIYCMLDLEGKFRRILLCRDKKQFNVDFYCFEEGGICADVDSMDDLPSTVQPFSTSGRNSAACQTEKGPENTKKGAYIWIKADEYVKRWLPEKGYAILESRIFEDCIGYRCIRKGYAYTIFMYAFGKRKTSQLDGKFCSKLADFPFAGNSTILIVYLNTKCSADGTKLTYTVSDFRGRDPEFWKLKKLNGAYILEFYPGREKEEQFWQFMYAFNRGDMDVYDCIIADANPSFQGDPRFPDGMFLNPAFYLALQRMHQEYGEMKLGYVRYNDVIYNAVPYVEGLGFFVWDYSEGAMRIQSVTCCPFDTVVAEFVKTQQREPDDLFAHIPKLTRAVPLPPVPGERLAAKLFFDNGECRKFVLPVPEKYVRKKRVPCIEPSITDDDWAKLSAVPHHKSIHCSCLDCGPAIMSEGMFIASGLRGYMESTPYSEEDDAERSKKICCQKQ